MNPFIQNSIEGMSGKDLAIIIVLAVWTVFWKISSMWIASKNNQKKWFMALAILNTFGIVEIVYIFYVAKKQVSDVTDIFSGSTK